MSLNNEEMGTKITIEDDSGRNNNQQERVTVNDSENMRDVNSSEDVQDVNIINSEDFLAARQAYTDSKQVENNLDVNYYSDEESQQELCDYLEQSSSQSALERKELESYMDEINQYRLG